MKLEDFPQEIRPYIIPAHKSRLIYQCIECNHTFGIENLLYTCPDCGKLLLIYDQNFNRLKKISGEMWRRIFDYRKMLTTPSALKGIYLYHEFIGPVIPFEAIVYLGEGHTPIVEANTYMQEKIGARFFFKNDGQNPSASFKDRGMASALSYLNFLIQKGLASNVLAICASTGDTSAAAALYASFLQPNIKSAVLLPHKKVTPQQLLQPLGSGAAVFEIPGVFDDCMKIVEHLSETYNVALLNSKNAWRILGQESFAYEVSQAFEYDMDNKIVVIPVGNAGNITAIMNGFIKFFETGIINTLPKIIGVQSEHANPVYQYYQESDESKRTFTPVKVKPSVAQAAMIGNPVSMPRVIHLVKLYNQLAQKKAVFFVEVSEQMIMDCELEANKNGHIICTQGGESLAGFTKALRQGIVKQHEVAILDSTAHALKFADFTNMYFGKGFPKEFDITPHPAFINHPHLITANSDKKDPHSGGLFKKEDDFNLFVKHVSDTIATSLKLIKKE
jgi:threonine synthase